MNENDELGVRIYDAMDGSVSINILDILDEIENGSEYRWEIYKIVGFGKPSVMKEVIDFCEKVNNCNGLAITWEELMNIAEKFVRLVDLKLVGKKEGNENNKIVVEFFEGWLISVCSNDPFVLQNLKDKFKKIQIFNLDNYWNMENFEEICVIDGMLSGFQRLETDLKATFQIDATNSQKIVFKNIKNFSCLEIGKIHKFKALSQKTRDLISKEFSFTLYSFEDEGGNQLISVIADDFKFVIF